MMILNKTGPVQTSVNNATRNKHKYINLSDIQVVLLILFILRKLYLLIDDKFNVKEFKRKG